MNHCIDCGCKVSRGRTHTTDTIVRCMVCETKRVMQDFRYETPVMKLRKQAREQANGT